MKSAKHTGGGGRPQAGRQPVPVSVGKPIGAPQNIGLDALKLVAAFTVVLIHAPNPWNSPSQAYALRLLPPANACFALVAGMLMGGLFAPSADVGVWLQKRIRRLAIPYLIWGAAYLLTNLLFDFLRSGGTSMPVRSMGWWLNCIFLGAGSVQLWFVVMLFYSQCAVALAWWACRTRLSLRIFKYLAGAVGLVAGVGFRAMEADTPQRFFVFITGYLLIGIVLAWIPRSSWHERRWAWVAPVMGLVAVRLLTARVELPQPWSSLLVFLTPLLWVTAACSLSSIIPPGGGIMPAAACAMGIYLVHVFFTRLLLLGSPYLVTLLGQHLYPIYAALAAFALSLSVVMATRRVRFLWGN